MTAEAEKAIREYEAMTHQERYKLYLESERWKKKRQHILERDKGICQCCFDNPATEIHHLTYDRIGNELSSDLLSLCRNCHENTTHTDKIKSMAGKKKTFILIYGNLTDYILSNYPLSASEMIEAIRKKLFKNINIRIVLGDNLNGND